MTAILLVLCAAGAAAQDICEEGGGGMFFPLFANEHEWPEVGQGFARLLQPLLKRWKNGMERPQRHFSPPADTPRAGPLKRPFTMLIQP